MNRRRGLSFFQVGVIALVVTIVACYLGFTKSIPFRQHFEIDAAFQSTNNIKKGSPVRIAGVEVGKVSKVAPTSPGADSAVVTMRIKDNGRPVHADATAKIRPRIFLEGNFFVDLTAGSPAAPVLDDGDTIPATQTSTPVQFDQVLKALKMPTRKAAQETLGGLAEAFDAGFAKSFNDTLDDQAPAFRYTSIVLESLLGRRPHDLSNVIRDLAKTSAALDESPPRLQSLLTNFNRTALALARESDNLQDTVAELPRTLQAAQPALDELNASFPSVRRFAVEALPGVRSSGPAITALRPFVAQTRGLVQQSELRGFAADLRGATPGLVQLSRRALPLLEQMRLLSSCTNRVILPFANDMVQDKAFPAQGKVYEEAAQFLPGLGGESRSFDANGPWMKVLGSGGAETVQLGNGVFGFPISQVSGTNPPKPDKRPPLRPDVPCETQETPNLESIATGPPPTTKESSSPLPPLVRKRYEKAKESALVVMQEMLRRDGIDAETTTKDATSKMVESMARKAGNLPQLEVLRKGMPLTEANIRKAGG